MQQTRRVFFYIVPCVQQTGTEVLVEQCSSNIASHHIINMAILSCEESISFYFFSFHILFTLFFFSCSFCSFFSSPSTSSLFPSCSAHTHHSLLTHSQLVCMCLQKCLMFFLLLERNPSRLLCVCVHIISVHTYININIYRYICIKMCIVWVFLYNQPSFFPPSSSILHSTTTPTE